MLRKTKKTLRKIFLLFLAAVFCVILLDLGLRVIFFAYDSIENHKQTALRKEQTRRDIEAQKKVYGNESAAVMEAVLEEQRQAHNWRFYPFVVWRNKEFNGRYMNISAEGIRRTWNPVQPQGRIKKIFCMGGSAMWGMGARDEHTIPSLVSKKLHDNGFKNYQVTNFGEEAYTSTQELVLLMLKLRDGDIPDYVLFYDGANDIFAVVQPGGEPGSIHSLEDLRNKFEKKEISDIQMFNRGLGALLEDKSGVRRVIKTIRTTIKEKRRTGTAETGTAEAAGDERIRALSSRVLDTYFANIAVVESLAKTYGFKYSFFWQPSLYHDKPQTAHETWLAGLKGEECKRFYEITHEELGRRTDLPKHFVNLDSIFSRTQETIYLDLCHVSEEGNRVIADRIFELIRNGLKNSKEAPRD